MKPPLKTILVSLIIVLSITALSAQETPVTEKPPDYRSMMTLNSLMPGYAQFAMGYDAQGWLCAPALPLSIAGNVLVLWYLIGELDYLNRFSHTRAENKTYFYYHPDAWTNSRQWIFFTGNLMVLSGTLLSVYSQYSARWMYVDKYGASAGLENRGFRRDSLWDLVLAPWVPDNVFNWDVFPFFPMTVVAGIAGTDFARIGSYFNRESVDFLGLKVNPWAGLGLVLASSIVMVSANAAWEEIEFRGIALENSGIVWSSVSFGLAHVPNMLMPNTSVEDTLLQTAYATLYGFYAAFKSREAGFDFRRMIALHFWNNVLAFTLNYLINPDEQLYFQIRVPVVF